VVAAAHAYGGDAGAAGIVVKLTRTLMLIPIVIVLAILKARRETTGLSVRAMPWRKIVPTFLVGFIVATGLDSLGLIPTTWHPALSVLGTKAGRRPLLLGALLWVAVATSSLGLQALTGTI
jgi:uncharacterized membrane protein YadS